MTSYNSISKPILGTRGMALRPTVEYLGSVFNGFSDVVSQLITDEIPANLVPVGMKYKIRNSDNGIESFESDKNLLLS